MNVEVSEKTEKVVYLFRHGQSEDNAMPVFQGPDSPLSKHGQQQAKFIAERVKQLEFEVLISSPFERAKQTAELISAVTKKDIEFSDLFVERVKPSSLYSKKFSDDEANKIWEKWQESTYAPGLRVEDGENYDDIVLRSEKALQYLYDRPEKQIAVTSHGYFIRTLIAQVLLGDSLAPQNFRHLHNSMYGMENTGVAILVFEPQFQQEARWRLLTYNDHAHLYNF